MDLASTVYTLEGIVDDPKYEGFGCPNFPNGTPKVINSRGWRVVRLARNWIPLEVKGRVRKFNDYPTVNGIYPAFSARAVDALRDFLEPNGELLPLKSSVGPYFAYNTTTIADVLDQRHSEFNWLKKPVIAGMIHRYAFKRRAIENLSIFRIPEDAVTICVTDRFARRAEEHGLQGLNFIKVWPFPEGVSWMQVDKAQWSRQLSAGLPKGQTVKGNTLVIRLWLADAKSKGSAAEKKAIDKIMDQLDAVLVDLDSAAPVVGSLEGHDYGVPGECRLFISCPDVDALLDKLRPTLKGLDWPTGFALLKRYGPYRDFDAPEEEGKL